MSGNLDDSDNDDGDDQWREEMEDREFLVQEAMRRIPLNVDVPIDLRPSDIKDDQLVENLMNTGCGCTKWNGRGCSNQFSTQYIRETRLSFMGWIHVDGTVGCFCQLQ